MKRYKCPICGNEVFLGNEEIRCKNCNTLLDRDMILNNDALKKKKFDCFTYASNLDFKTIIDLDYDKSELIFDYYTMYSNICLKRDYNINEFFKRDHKFSVDELDHVILHMLEHIKLYDYKLVKDFINKYAPNNEKYERIFISIVNRMDERIIEKDLREELFPETRIPFKQKLYNSRFEDGKSILLVGIVLMIVFPLIVFIFFKDDLKYSMFNVALIIPILFLTSGICKMSLKKNNIFIYLLIFILLYYFLTLLYGFSYMKSDGFILFDHLKGIIYTPYDLVKALIESTGK